MSGNNKAAIDHYSTISNIEMDDDHYHSYFYALALRGNGDINKSTQIMKRVANNTFATREARTSTTTSKTTTLTFEIFG